tara:strand:- start:200 stop:811 length:612 start_codon:yes stop_codon:yes gene_type:complete
MDWYCAKGFRLKMKKNISKSKVQRMRNLVTGDHTKSISIQSGYGKSEIRKKKEGDVWEERGKEWTIKDGIKQTITKLDAAREQARIPMECPKCQARMNRQQHKFMYVRFKHCLFCQMNEEEEMRKNGTYDTWKKEMIAKNWERWMYKSKAEFQEWLISRKAKKQITEAGDIEDWSGGQTDEQLLADFDKYILSETEKMKDVTK